MACMQSYQQSIHIVNLICNFDFAQNVMIGDKHESILYAIIIMSLIANYEWKTSITSMHYTN